MTTKKAIKALVQILLDNGYKYKRAAKHGNIYVSVHGTIAVGGSPSDCNFHRQAIRDINKQLAYLNIKLPYLN